MKKDIKLIKEIINELYETNYEFNSLTLSYFTKFIPEMTYDIEFDFNNSVTDDKLLESSGIFSFIDNKNNKLMIKLNHLLDLKDRDERVTLIEEKIIEIQSKKNITVREFEKIYNISISSQRDYRCRIKDPLPFHQKVKKGKIVYVVEEVEKWFENQHK